MLVSLFKYEKMKTSIIYIALFAAGVSMMGCEYDNYEEPKAMLYGNVVYEGQPIGLRTNGPQMELWQDGYELRTSIPVFIAQDGSYSVALFNGEYKLVRKAGGPWVPELTDTLIIQVKGQTEFDIPVTPYYVITDETYESEGTTVSVTFQLDQIVEEASLQEVNLYLGYSVLTDQNKNEYVERADVAGISLTSANTIVASIPESLQEEAYLFARVGIRSSQSGEFYYSQVQKIDL